MLSVIAYPKLDDDGRENLVQSYIKDIQSPLELLDELTYNDYSGIETLRDELGRKI